MELSRSEREISKPINWGKITYDNIEKRKKDRSKLPPALRVPPPNPEVRVALEANATVRGPLDGCAVLRVLSEEDQCDFFSRYPHCEVLHMRGWGWKELSLNTLRAISVSFGEQLTEVDFSHAEVTNNHLQILFVRSPNLSVLRLNHCATMDTTCTQTLVQLLHRSLSELYVCGCRYFRTEPLQWIGGTMGLHAQSLSRLRCLDLGGCPVSDKGLAAVAVGCRRLVFLNLVDCAEITDSAVIAVAKASPKLRLLNISNCTKLTSKTAVAIGRSCPELTSLNMSRLVNITDKGVTAIAQGCRHLQAINLAGLKLITEASMLQLGENCRSLLIMNLTGCEHITVNGLNALIRGLDYVESGLSFTGFKPIDEHIDRKLNDQLNMIQQTATRAEREQRQLQERLERAQAFAQQQHINAAVGVIVNYMYRYKIRMHFYRLWRQRVRKESAITLQRIYRGYRGRLRAIAAVNARQEFMSNSPYALLIQQAVRGFLTRLHCQHVSKKIRELYIIRRKEAVNAIATRLQTHLRRMLAVRYVQSHQELSERRALNVHHAMLSLQLLARRFVSTLRVQRRRRQLHTEREARDSAALKIKCFLLERMRNYKSKLSGEELKRFYRVKWAACTEIQRFFRGFSDCQRVRKLRIKRSAEYYAARDIQRIYRGTQVLHWRDMRLNVIAAFALDRHYVERRQGIAAARMRYKQYVQENQRDSASDPDDEEDDGVLWLQQYDTVRRMPFWQNFATNEIVYDEPPDPLAQQKGMIGQRAKVYWIVQGAWYEGSITRFHKRKQRHRIEYDDGDHEWINLEEESDRLQIQLEDGTWSMYNMFKSDALLYEFRRAEEKMQRDEFKAQAYRDALQWRSFQDDVTGAVMFLSQASGEIRTGAADALLWSVQDDGVGFPVFYNSESGATVYEDPRFLHEEHEDLAAQRRFVMQELRMAAYFCRDLWEKYEQESLLNDPRQLQKATVAIRNSPKPIHLSSFLIRAKALYQQTSVVDKPTDQSIVEELQYAAWLAERLAEVNQQAEDFLLQRRDKKRALVDKLTATSGQRVFCRNCKRETQRQLEFCPTCGKPQVLFYTEESLPQS